MPRIAFDDWVFSFGEHFFITKGGRAYTPLNGNTQQFSGTNADVRKDRLDAEESRPKKKRKEAKGGGFGSFQSTMS